MRGRARKVFDNLEAVEVQFLSPRCQDDAHAPRLRLTLNVGSCTSSMRIINRDCSQAICVV
jgi:hypothetical protein